MKTIKIPFGNQLRRNDCGNGIVGLKGRVLVSALAVLISLYGSSVVAANITIKGDQAMTHLPNVQGFLHGFDDVSYDEKRVNMVMMNELRPKFWRIGMTDKAGLNHILAKKVNPNQKITLVVSDQLAVIKGSYQALKPWENWNAYQQLVRDLVSLYKQHNLNIDYWDVWSEPDTTAMWSGSCAQAMETFKRTFEAIRSVDSSAKIVGPSVSDINSKGACGDSFFGHFLNYVAEQNLKFDAISWHEFNHPEQLPAQAEVIRQFFAKHPSLGMPEMHVNEYSGPLDAPIAGWAVGWLYYLEAANLNWATRACWGQGCQAGLDWLFTKNTATTPLYWVHQSYANLPSMRLRSVTDTPSVVAMAGKNDAKQELSVLVGRFSGKQVFGAAENVTLVIENFPYHLNSVSYTVKRIPRTLQPTQELVAPIPVSNENLPVTNSTVTLSLPAFQDGDAYLLSLKAVQ